MSKTEDSAMEAPVPDQIQHAIHVAEDTSKAAEAEGATSKIVRNVSLGYAFWFRSATSKKLTLSVPALLRPSCSRLSTSHPFPGGAGRPSSSTVSLPAPSIDWRKRRQDANSGSI